MMAMFGLTDESGMTDGELRGNYREGGKRGAGYRSRSIRLDPDRHFLCAGLADRMRARLTVRFFYEGFFWHYDPACQ